MNREVFARLLISTRDPTVREEATKKLMRFADKAIAVHDYLDGHDKLRRKLRHEYPELYDLLKDLWVGADDV